MNEIHMFDTFVADTSILEDQSVLDAIQPGDKLTLKREENKFDEKAILLITQDGRKRVMCPKRTT